MSLKTKEALTGWLFISPVSIFTFGSIIYSLYLSLTDYDLMTKPKFIGLENFIRAFTKDEYFYKFFGNTLYFVVFLVPIVLVISLLLALLINNLLTAIGFNNPPMWLNSPETSKMALIIMRVWQMSGYYMIMFLAGLQTIPESLYESAQVDGANKIQSFFKITLPMLSNTTFVVIILLVIEAFNMFESIFIMTNGGPLGSTSTIMYYIYEQGFGNYNMGYASAIAWIFFVIIMIITLIQYKFRNEQGGE